MPVTLAFFLETALKSTALLTVAFVAALGLRGKSAALRHLVWIAALAAVLTLPFFSTALPAWRVPLVNGLLPDGFVFRTDARAASLQPTAPQSHLPINPALPGPKQWLLALWALGAAISFTQIAIGWAAVERLRRSAKPITLPGIADNIDLRQTAAGTMPITYGLFRPVILLPAGIMEWNAERRSVVLLHELAHVRRKDGATHLLARVALALYWWHPLVWTAWRESLKERERAADDMVLNAGAGAPEYASHLLAIARSIQSSPTVALAMARPSQLQSRLAAILDSTTNRTAPRRASALAASLTALAILLPVAALRAQNDTGQVVFKGRELPLSPATPLLEQGKNALSNKNYDLATALFERAQTADPKKTAEARMWMAITQQHQNNLQEADALYQIALSAADPNSSAATTIMELYASLLRDENKQEEATKMADQAAGLRKAQAELAMSMHQPSSPDVHRIGGEVRAPSLERKVEPEYTNDARLARYSGSVLLAIEVGEDGSPRNIRVIRALGFGLDQKAVEAVSKWKFKPGILGGQPAAVMAQVEVNFRLL